MYQILRRVIDESIFFFCRTEFWKSTGKKFCDFCKCWIADNKPVSITYNPIHNYNMMCFYLMCLMDIDMDCQWFLQKFIRGC